MLSCWFTGLAVTKSQKNGTIFYHIFYLFHHILVTKTGLDGHIFFQIFKSEMSLMDDRLLSRAEGGSHRDFLVLQKNTFMERNFTAVGVRRK